MAIHPTYTALILTDWQNEGAKVTLTLHAGGTFTGTVKMINQFGEEGTVTLVAATSDRREVIHEVDLTAVAAITAEARR